MHLPRLRLRLRLRTLLIAVAVAGLVSGGWQMWKRREYCLEQARWLESSAVAHHDLAATEEALHCTPRAASYREAERRLTRWAARYRHVARYPWLPMPREPE